MNKIQEFRAARRYKRRIIWQRIVSLSKAATIERAAIVRHYSTGAY